MPPRRPAGRRIRTGGVERDRPPARFRGPVRRIDVSKRPSHTSANGTVPAPSTDAIGQYGRQWGWDADFEVFTDFDLPTYVGPTSFSNLPWIDDPAEIARRKVDVAIIGAPFDDMVTHRPGARFGPRAIRG